MRSVLAVMLLVVTFAILAAASQEAERESYPREIIDRASGVHMSPTEYIVKLRARCIKAYAGACEMLERNGLPVRPCESTGDCEL